MAEKTLNTIIVLRNDSSTDWASSEVILKSGELGVSYLPNGNVMVKAGNGIDKWVDLPQVESVLENDMMLTYSFGKHSVPAGGSLNAGVLVSPHISAVSFVYTARRHIPTATLPNSFV